MNIKYLLIYSCTTSEYKKETHKTSVADCADAARGFTQIYRLQSNSVTWIFWICTIVYDGATQKTVPTDSFEGRWGGHDEAFSRMLPMEDGEGSVTSVDTRRHCRSTQWENRIDCGLNVVLLSSDCSTPGRKMVQINRKVFEKYFLSLILFHLNCVGVKIYGIFIHIPPLI